MILYHLLLDVIDSIWLEGYWAELFALVASCSLPARQGTIVRCSALMAVGGVRTPRSLTTASLHAITPVRSDDPTSATPASQHACFQRSQSCGSKSLSSRDPTVPNSGFRDCALPLLCSRSRQQPCIGALPFGIRREPSIGVTHIQNPLYANLHFIPQYPSIQPSTPAQDHTKPNDRDTRKPSNHLRPTNSSPTPHRINMPLAPKTFLPAFVGFCGEWKCRH